MEPTHLTRLVGKPRRMRKYEREKEIDLCVCVCVCVFVGGREKEKESVRCVRVMTCLSSARRLLMA